MVARHRLHRYGLAAFPHPALASGYYCKYHVSSSYFRLPRKRDEGKLIQAMGFATANVHFGDSKVIKAIQRILATRKATWLRGAAKRMTSVTLSDWTEWTRSKSFS